MATMFVIVKINFMGEESVREWEVGGVAELGEILVRMTEELSSMEHVCRIFGKDFEVDISISEFKRINSEYVGISVRADGEETGREVTIYKAEPGATYRDAGVLKLRGKYTKIGVKYLKNDFEIDMEKSDKAALKVHEYLNIYAGDMERVIFHRRG
jgi:hypothetical protein